jgi:hypothetical protein
LGVPGQKGHLDVGLVERCKVYYKGEGGDFPQVQAVVSLMSSNLPVARPSTKNENNRIVKSWEHAPWFVALSRVEGCVGTPG